METVKKLSYVWAIIMILIFSFLTYFAMKWKGKYQGYFDLEEKLVSVTQSYFESNHAYPEGSDVVIIKLYELKENNVIDELSYNNDSCNGYVEVKNKGVMEYKGYIKCENYTTKGYQE